MEAAAQRAELEARITRITEDLRRAAQTEMHSTTRRALQENEALTRQLEVFRSRITSLRSDNTSFRDALSDSQVTCDISIRGERCSASLCLEVLSYQRINFTCYIKVLVITKSLSLCG